MPIDYKKYHPQWKDSIRPEVLKRANYRCERCGVSNRALGYRDKSGNFVECDAFMLDWCRKVNIKVLKIVLTIAHLDQNVDNNDMGNLRAMCQRCHLNHDRVYNIAKRKGGKVI